MVWSNLVTPKFQVVPENPTAALFISQFPPYT